MTLLGSAVGRARAVAATRRLLADAAHRRVLLRDLLGGREPRGSDDEHLAAAMQWLCAAQDRSGSGGVCANYSLRVGWRPAYPETTGYIIPTFLRYAELSGDPSMVERARRMGDWEITVQHPSGGVRPIGVDRDPLVFDTGQVILGWVPLYRATRESRYLEAATRAGEWLLEVQDDDGAWRRYAYHGTPHVYYTRVAWSLFMLGECTGDERFKASGERNIRWTLAQRRPNGWLDHAAFRGDRAPLTHTIAYALSGLLESLACLPADLRATALEELLTACRQIVSTQRLDRQNGHDRDVFLPGTLDENWESHDRYTCLTGNAQLAIVLLKLHQMTGDASFERAASALVDDVKSAQTRGVGHPGIHGGIPGSRPLWGSYSSYNVLSWATKFFADALLVRKGLGHEVG